FEDLPADVVSSVKERVLDTLGVALAASPLETSRGVRTVATGWGSGAADASDAGGPCAAGWGSGAASAIGVPGRVSPHAAALVNGTLAHSLASDDTHLASILHPSACIVPASLAAGQAFGSAGRDVVTAAAAAYEICVRLGMAAYD